MADLLVEILVDNLLLLPFLFPTYLVLEAIEAHAGSALERTLGRARRWGPLVGSLSGAVPQCGFSAAAASLYAGGVITVGTLVAVFLSTSDELIPVLVSKKMPVDLLVKIVGFKVTRGIMAALRRPRELSADEVLRDARRVAVLDGLVDATNVGAIMRSAAAFGVDAVLLSPTCADPLSRRACRVSMGTVFQLPWVHLGEAEGEWGRWPEGALGSLRAAGFHVAAMALEDGATVLDDPALCEHERLALVFGTEGWGLPRRTLACCDECVIIPMAAGVDSLNVASSSAVAFWQLCR